MGQRRRRQVSITIAIASALISVATGALALTGHLPFSVDRQGAARTAAELGVRSGQWSGLHLLAVRCDCSRRIAAHLIARGRMSGLEERVVLIGRDTILQRAFEDHGWPVLVLASEDKAAAIGIHGVPAFIVMNPQNSLAYAGGYSQTREQRGRGEYEDEAVWRALRSGHAVAPLPVYGCAVGGKLQKRIDPLGLKYGFLRGTR